MKVDLACHHSGCNKKEHRLVFDIPKVCGVMHCTRQVTTKIRQGFTYYEVCSIHAQGFEEVILEEEAYESDN